VTRQGYTFQTVLGTMGLNHMNGRIEDSVTGRFLSPDKRTPQRYNTQSWNRYTYVNNNPLTLKDPSGFDDCGDGASLACIQLPPIEVDLPPPVTIASNDNNHSFLSGAGLVICIGNCGNFGFSSAPSSQTGSGSTSGYWQANPGENVSITSAGGSTSPYTDSSQLQNDDGSLNELTVEAHPYTWVDTSTWGNFSSYDSTNLAVGIGRSPQFRGYSPYINGTAAYLVGSIFLISGAAALSEVPISDEQAVQALKTFAEIVALASHLESHGASTAAQQLEQNIRMGGAQDSIEQSIEQEISPWPDSPISQGP